MKRKPKLTRRERQADEAKAARARLTAIVQRLVCSPADKATALRPTATPFERAAALLLTMYEPAVEDQPIPHDEVVDAALVMVDIMQQGRELSIEDAVESMVGICADSARSAAVKAELNPALAHHLRLLFTRLPTNPTILARSAEFDVSMDRLASEIS
mgnify:FL=1